MLMQRYLEEMIMRRLPPYAEMRVVSFLVHCKNYHINGVSEPATLEAMACAEVRALAKKRREVDHIIGLSGGYQHNEDQKLVYI
jgi:hypothetical protein